jgi:hypothetical protein
MNPDGGILVLEEYVGPVCWQFPPEHVAEIVRLSKDLERDHPNYIPILCLTTIDELDVVREFCVLIPEHFETNISFIFI